jgi:predicted kinase
MRGAGSADVSRSAVTWDIWEYQPVSPVLVVVSGLPASGKSSLARPLAEYLRTPYIRVDRIEQAIVDWSALKHPVGPVGYAVAHQIIGEQLTIGLDAIVECVNPLAVTRDAWVGTAEAADAAVVEVELVCSDQAEHRRRVETRMSDVEGLIKPTWDEVLQREYESWERPHLVLDTAATPVSVMIEQIEAEMDAVRAQRPA